MEKKAAGKPAWLKTGLPSGKKYLRVREIVELNKLHTICSSGHCPNLGECWGRGTATLMILGDICTRSCRFCNVTTGRPAPVDCEEPSRIAETIKKMGVRHCVITSVDRDDLPDKGSGIWAETIRAVQQTNPTVTLEALIPDFDGDIRLLQHVTDTKPDVISHNLETVERLTPLIRSKAKYHTSLSVIAHIARAGIRSKSGIMAGLGETEEEVYATMDDLRKAGCEVFTIGQYLRPTMKHMEVQEYIHPEMFDKYREEGLKRGFVHVESGPLVRSSYHAEKHIA